MKYSITQQSVIGTRSSNQDRAGFAERDNSVLMVLADGLGGYAGGELAAETFVSNILSAYEKIKASFIADPIAFIVLSIAHSHSMINRRAKQHGIKAGDPRTTGVVCLVQDGFAYWGHVGDSRLYHFRDRKVMTRTEDHSTSEQMRAAGGISEEDMRLPELQGQLLRCAGGPKRPVVTLGAETPLETGDILLLCSDGVWRALPIADISRHLHEDKLELGLDDLLRRGERNARKDCDNMSAIVLRWEGERTTTEPLAPDKLGEREQAALWREARQARLDKKVRRSRTHRVQKSGRPSLHRDSIELMIEELESFINNLEGGV